MRRHWLCGLGIALLAAGLARADRGAIVTVGKVDIAEPAQRALIAHNGAEELLILQTDVQADRETKVVEFMPLPSKPAVSLAPEGCFAALATVVTRHELRYVIQYRGKNGGEGPDVEVVVAEQLGPHAVTVVEARDADAFVAWVRGFFQQQGLGEPAVGGDLRRIATRYIDAGCRFFAFDVVTLSPAKQTVRPLTYRFRSPHIYYPLIVSHLYGGSGTVELLLLQPPGMQGYGAISIRPPAEELHAPKPVRWRFLRSTTARLSRAEMASLHPDIPALIGGDGGILRAVKYEGPLRFRDDVRVPVLGLSAEGAAHDFLQALVAGSLERLEVLLDVPFAFDRKQVLTDKAALLELMGKVLAKTRGRPLPVSRIQTSEAARAGFVRSDFDKAFVREHLTGPPAVAVLVTVEDEQILIFVRRDGDRRFRVVGFSD